MEIGYSLSSEEHGPAELVEQARMAADAGFESAWISDHFHPWLDDQGHSPFVWGVIGAVATATPLWLMTGVTCPTMRIHPAIVAHAAATSSLLLDGRFELGVGSGENLNEHVLGDPWPLADERLDMLREAIDVMRALWQGEEVTFRGTHFLVENARLYSIPETPPPVLMSAFGPKAVDVAASTADGFVSTHPDREQLHRYRDRGGRGKAVAGTKLCWGPDKDESVKIAHRLWRSSGVPGELSQELRTPALFEQATALVSVESMAKEMPCGPDTDAIVMMILEFQEARFDRLYLNQIGTNQREFFEYFAADLGPTLEQSGVVCRRQ